MSRLLYILNNIIIKTYMSFLSSKKREKLVFQKTSEPVMNSTSNNTEGREMVTFYEYWVYKTQCQLCKRLAGPFIPLSWSCLVWKRILLWMWSLGGRQQPFSCVLGHFRQGDKQTNEQPGEPSASLLLTSVRRQSFAKSKWISNFFCAIQIKLSEL